ncbi:MAG: TRAP transporter substrate-binding protein [Pseudomonadota bacterium]
MKQFIAGLIFAASWAASLSTSASAQEVTLRLHHFLPPQSAVPANFIEPWARQIEAESDGRIAVQLFPAMQLGGKPSALYDQARDGVVDIIWTLTGYTPGRFPRSEVLELPFIALNAEKSSRVAWQLFEDALREDFGDVHMLAVHVHSPGVIHVKGDGVATLEDMSGLTLRAPTQAASALLTELGATPVGMPVPAVPEALSRGVIDGTVIPWEVATPLRIAELVDAHTEFAGPNSLYTAFFVLAMNQERYDSLPEDLQTIIDNHSGEETAAWIGRVMDEADATGIAAAEREGNPIITIAGEEEARWQALSETVIADWIASRTEAGIDAQALVDRTRELMAEEAKN